jgi:Lon protease-like protein
MAEIGLFPLGMVLLPAEQVPLHVFEPRYKELIGECLAEGREFGLVYADDEGMRQVGTRASVVEVLDRFDDGRLNVVVQGGERFRLVELTSGRSFQTAEVESLDDRDDPGDPADAERALALYRRLVELTGSEVEDPDPNAPQLSFELAGRFEFAPALKQELLQETSERLRLSRLCSLLETAAETVERQREIATRAASNGKVDPRTLPEEE